MTTILSKKDFKMIGISSKNPEKVIIELDKKTLDGLIGPKRRIKKYSEDITLKEYIKSGEVNNLENISGVYNSVNDLLISLK